MVCVGEGVRVCDGWVVGGREGGRTEVFYSVCRDT